MLEKRVKHRSTKMRCVFGGKAAGWQLQHRMEITESTSTALVPSSTVGSRLQWNMWSEMHCVYVLCVYTWSLSPSTGGCFSAGYLGSQILDKLRASNNLLQWGWADTFDCFQHLLTNTFRSNCSLWKRVWQRLSSLYAWFMRDLLQCPSDDPFLAKNLLFLCMLTILQNMSYVRFAWPILPDRTVCCEGILGLFFLSKEKSKVLELCFPLRACAWWRGRWLHWVKMSCSPAECGASLGPWKHLLPPSAFSKCLYSLRGPPLFHIFPNRNWAGQVAVSSVSLGTTAQSQSAWGDPCTLGCGSPKALAPPSTVGKPEPRGSAFLLHWVHMDREQGGGFFSSSYCMCGLLLSCRARCLICKWGTWTTLPKFSPCSNLDCLMLVLLRMLAFTWAAGTWFSSDPGLCFQ